MAGINNIDEANALLPAYIEAHNQQFGKEPTCSEDAHRPLRTSDNLKRLFARHETRKLSKNLTFQHHSTLYQLVTDTPNRLRYATIDIFCRPGEPIEVEYAMKPLKYTSWQETVYEQPKILGAKELEALWWPSRKIIPAMNHPWRKGLRKVV